MKKTWIKIICGNNVNRTLAMIILKRVLTDERKAQNGFA